MVALNPPPAELGKKAPSFSLKCVDGKTHSLDELKGKNGTLVMFICNHCPFVKAIVDKLAKDADELIKNGVAVIAINANNPLEYPEDSYDNMKIFAREHKFNFHYLFDETQDVAKAFGAVCTPDFFGYNSNLELQYRGRFDDSGMQQKPNSKHELLEAMLEISRTGKFAGEQKASIGCSIKWV